VKEGWQVGTLADYSILVSTGPFGSILHKSDYAEDGVPLVNPSNIVDGRIIPDPEKLLRPETTQRLQTYILQEGDLVVARRGEIGRCAVVGRQEAGWICGTGSFFIRPRPHVNSHFLASLIRSEDYRNRLEAASTGATMKNLSNSALADLLIRVPPLPEQQRIVAILDEAFAAIATAKANAEKNLQNARAVFEGFLHEIFASPDPSWPSKSLSEIASQFGRGKSKHRPRNDAKLYGGQYPFIQTGDVRNSLHLVQSYSQTYSDFGLAQSKLWPAGTLCITIAANIAETGVLGFDACFPDSVIGLVPDPSKANVHFLEYLLRHYKTLLQSLGKGSAQDNINLGTFESQQFPIPPLEIQVQLTERFDSLLEGTLRLESLCRRKLDALDELKQSLLHRAFNGDL
jgi:type I restriction enzyme S subunit